MIRDDDGYTLTEMLVVIGIISLLAAVLTPGLVNQLGRARVKAAQLQLQTVSSALASFDEDVGRFPTTAEGLEALVSSPAGTGSWIGPYIRNAKALLDPWGHPLQYRLASGASEPELMSLGADRKQGGRGMDADLHAP